LKKAFSASSLDANSGSGSLRRLVVLMVLVRIAGGPSATGGPPLAGIAARGTAVGTAGTGAALERLVIDPIELIS
jgi:hypothetical protein